MRRRPSSFVRAVALATAFFALGIAAGCGRETFDLLPDQSLVGASSAAGARNESGAAGIGGNAAVSGTAGGGGGGSAGKSELGGAGAGGRVLTFPGAGGGSAPCGGGEGGCVDGEPFCPPYSPSPFCIPCFSNYDCATNVPDAKVCDPDLKRCVQCRRDGDCGKGNTCNPLTQRCARACDRKDDCVTDSQHLLCNTELHACVSCNRDPDCASYGLIDAHCFLYACVECYDDRQCGVAQSCIAGHCTKH